MVAIILAFQRRILEGDYAFHGLTPISISNVTLSGGARSDTSNSDCGYGGGAVLTGGSPWDNSEAG